MASYIYNEKALEFDGKVWHQLEYVNIITNHGELLYGEIFEINPTYLVIMNAAADFREIKYEEIVSMY